MSSPPEFFTGYGEVPPALSRFLVKVIVGLLASSFVLALMLGLGVQDRGDGRYSGEIRATGVLFNLPYPVLRLLPTAADPQGHTMLVAGGGKIGAGDIADKAKGRVVELRGFGLKRGTLDMIVVDEESQVQPAAAPLPLFGAPVLIGRYLIAGEICDGKCYPGGMRPGTGLAHKACANLCIIGRQPAIFAAQSPIEGQSFLLLANKDGALPPPVLYDHTALPVEIEGEVMRAGDLLIFHADWSTLRKQ